MKEIYGVASCLLKYIIHFSKNHHVTSITLEVNEKNTAAISLYQKFNFIPVGVRKKYYHHTDNAILMTHMLS
ncbi:MAG: GNAT family N-acetyltransferase [Clostridia bacterium]|nr:GNAT family N-acetyltransferase [Clostridia bacterium]